MEAHPTDGAPLTSQAAELLEDIASAAENKVDVLEAIVLEQASNAMDRGKHRETSILRHAFAS